MFSHRGLFLAVTISLASTALAGVLFQPGYEYHIESNPRYSASTESSKSEIIAHDNDEAAKSSLTDAKHPTTIESLLAENEPIDKIFNNFLVFFRELNLDSLTNTLPEHEPNDKRLENCQSVKNSLLPHRRRMDDTFLLSLISSLPKHEPADTNDKRVENCQAETNIIILYYQLILTWWKNMLLYLYGHPSTPSTSSTLDKYEDENFILLQLELTLNSLIANSLIAISSLPWTKYEKHLARQYLIHGLHSRTPLPPIERTPHVPLLIPIFLNQQT